MLPKLLYVVYAKTKLAPEFIAAAEMAAGILYFIVKTI